MLLAAGLVAHGVEVHVYCDPVTRTADVPGIAFHDVRSIRAGRTPASSRMGYPLERGSFALAATRALRRDRHLYDVVDVRQGGALEHDVLTVHGVFKAMQRRWPSEAGRTFRAARLRAFAGPVLRPQIAVDRAIQWWQLRPRRFLRVIAVTSQVRDDLCSLHGVPQDLVDIIPPPIDLDRLTSARHSGIRDSFAISAETPLTLFVGNSFQRKGLDTLVEALVRVPEAHLLVVGDGDPSSLRLLRDDSVARRVHFVGRVDDPERYYAEADLFVLPTLSDPWGIPLVEAMAAGLPVISTNAAGAAGVVEQAGAGLILREATPQTLAAALAALMADSSARTAMGQNGKTAAVRFGVEQHAAAVLATYDRALSANSGRD